MPTDRVELKTDGGLMDGYACRPDGPGTWPAVIFYMDAMGLRPALLGMAERLASHGYLVLVPNLYYRKGPHAPFDPKTAFVEGPERDRMMGFLRSVDNTLVMRDTAACLEYCLSQPTVAGDAVGCVGYCMGGRQALMAAGTFPERVVVAASFHGASLATDKPDSPHRLASQMRARLYIGVAELDHNFSPEERGRLDEALSGAGVAYVLETYPGAKHGFAVTDHPVYDRDSSERHWQTVAALLHETLKTGRR